MGSIIVRLRILPTDAGVKSSDVLASIKEKLPVGVEVKRDSEEPIAFGLVASILDLQIEEKDGAVDALEDAVRSSNLVSQVDIIGISRASTRLK